MKYEIYDWGKGEEYILYIIIRGIGFYIVLNLRFVVFLILKLVIWFKVIVCLLYKEYFLGEVLLRFD